MNGNKETVAYILIGIVLAWAINQVTALALSTDMPFVAVESDSMVPVFHKGDILVLKGEEEGKLKAGDIIVYSVEGRAVPIVHRLVKINPDGSYQTKGDANPGQLPFEFYVPHESVHGKVVLIVPYLGWVKIGVTEYVLPNVIYILVVCIIIAAVYYVGRRI